MKKKDFFIKSLKAGAFKKVQWVISAFSKIQEDSDSWRKDPFAYRIVQTPTSVFFVDPNNNNDLTLIEDVEDINEPLFKANERLDITPDDIINLKESINTCYGNLLFNYQCLVYPFNNKIPYMNGKVSAKRIEEAIVSKLTDNPVNPGDITVDEYLAMCEAVFHLENYMQLFTPAGSEKSLMTHPKMDQLKKELFEKYKDRLDDPAIFAEITQRLVDLDKEWLADDPASMNFYLKSKSFNVVRRKLFAAIGVDAGLSDGVVVTPIERSLQQGWTDEEFAQLNTSARGASYSRGAETALGGEQVKWLLRASSNMVVLKDVDCGSKLGTEHIITENFIGFTIIDSNNRQYILTEDNIKEHLNKLHVVRSPMYCLLENMDYCHVCVGPRLARNPTALFTAVSQIGSTFLSIYLAAAHSKAIEVAKMDTNTFLR